MPDQLVELNSRLAGKIPDIATGTTSIVIHALSSPTARIRNIPVQAANTALQAVIITVATSYCGADPERTPGDVWGEAAAFIIRFYPEIMVEEVLEAFRLASSGKWHEVDIAAYRGQFTIKMVGDVMKAYIQDRNQVRSAIDRALGEMTEAHLQKQQEEKTRVAREEFWSQFCAFKTLGFVPELEDIKFFWFESIRDHGGFDDFDEEQKKELWRDSFTLLKVEMRTRSNDPGPRTTTLRRLLDQMESTGLTPEDWKGARETLYKRLLIRQALINSAMDQIEEPKEQNRNPELPF